VIAAFESAIARVHDETGVELYALQKGSDGRQADVYRQQHRHPVMPFGDSTRGRACGSAGHACLRGQSGIVTDS
jgi:hypothetical protein